MKKDSVTDKKEVASDKKAAVTDKEEEAGGPEGRLSALYEEWKGVRPALLRRLPQAGGDRVYFRITGADGLTVIGAYGQDKAENEAFIGLDGVFYQFTGVVPQIYKVSADGSTYLLEDLGDVSLLSLIQKGEAGGAVEAALAALVDVQTVSRERWMPHVAARPFSRRQAMWDLNYFKYEYLKPSGVTFDEEALEDDFEAFARSLAVQPDELTGFMYRDFQSRNIFIKDGVPRFIDFQGGRFGPLLYDAISFLWQAKAGFTADERGRLLRYYAERLAERRAIDVESLLADAPKFAFFRTLQVLGAYGFRGLVQHRAHFIESIPAALANLSELIEQGVAEAYPCLEEVCRRLTADRRFDAAPTGGLHVKVFSFSYKKGYPADFSGNGGGFMFDCRAMHNPGRYEEYKSLTGLDAPVREFLEARGEVQPFIAHVLALVEPAVARYLQRGFTSLQIGFGCTGGQHRSVYCADAVAKALTQKFPDADVSVIHREQNIER